MSEGMNEWGNDKELKAQKCDPSKVVFFIKEKSFWIKLCIVIQMTFWLFQPLGTSDNMLYENNFKWKMIPTNIGNQGQHQTFLLSVYFPVAYKEKVWGDSSH